MKKTIKTRLLPALTCLTLFLFSANAGVAPVSSAQFTKGKSAIITSTVSSINDTRNFIYPPQLIFDFQNGPIAINYLLIAGIPTDEYPKKYPDQLGGCDDLFIIHPTFL